MKAPITRLLGSSKALVVLAVTIASYVGLYLGKAQWPEVEGFLKWILTAWLGAQAVEDAAKHVAQPKLEAAQSAARVQAAETATALIKASMPPPAADAEDEK